MKLKLLSATLMGAVLIASSGNVMAAAAGCPPKESQSLPVPGRHFPIRSIQNV
jgi:hypothetical protein